MALSRKLFLGCTTIGLGVPLLTLGGGLLWTVRTFGGDSQRLDEERAAARREGVPLTGEDLRSAPIPEKENAAIPIRQVLTLWPENKRSKDELALKTVIAGTATEAERTEARAVLTQLAPILALAHDAAARPGCNFEYDYNQGFKLLLPEMSPIRAMARLLCAEAALADSPEKAFASIQAVMQLGRHAGGTPILICGLVQVAVNSLAHRQFVGAVARFGNRALVQAVSMLSSWAEPLPFLHYLGSESVVYHIHTEQLISGKTTLKELTLETGNGNGYAPPFPMTATPPVVGPLVMRAWATRGLTYWRGTFKLL